MSARTNQKQSIYGEYVEGTILEIASGGGGAYTFQEIAKIMGLKPTHNLRKRLRTLEKLGRLSIVYGFVGKCATCLIYQIPDSTPSPNRNLDIPF